MYKKTATTFIQSRNRRQNEVAGTSKFAGAYSEQNRRAGFQDAVSYARRQTGGYG